MNEITTTLKEDVCAAVAAQVTRLDESIGREDSSAYESYGRIKDVLEQMQEAVTPLQKTLKEYWEEVVREHEDAQAAMLREMETKSEVAVRQMVSLAATVDRALRRLQSAAGQKVGQMTMDELEEADNNSDGESTDAGDSGNDTDNSDNEMAVDEDTGEVLVSER